MAKKPIQKQLPGTADEKHQDIIDAADAYEAIRNQRMESLREEIELKKKLIDVMKEHNLAEYTYNGKKVVFSADIKEVVKVTEIKADKEEE